MTSHTRSVRNTAFFLTVSAGVLITAETAQLWQLPTVYGVSERAIPDIREDAGRLGALYAAVRVHVAAEEPSRA